MNERPNAIIPPLIASAPNVGPTVCSCTILAGAGSLPILSMFAKSSASSTVKPPLICEVPPSITPFTCGAE